MPPTSWFLRFSAVIAVAAVLALAWTPADAATATAKSAASQAAGGAQHQHVGVAGDSVQVTGARTRRAKNAWKGRRITYFENLPSKWDWSLSTAVAKWDTAGGGIRFVRTMKPKKAQVTISYGNTGAAAGMATVGRVKHAWVHLSSYYNGVDSLDAVNRVEVVAVLTHELGHVLGFEHTAAKCSTMSPVIDVVGCGVVPMSRPGYYKCRTIDNALLAGFVRMYGGAAREPGTWCLIDALPPTLTGVTVSAGSSADAPATVRWTRPRAVPSGSRVQIRAWSASSCGAVPGYAYTDFQSASAGSWRDPSQANDSCFRVELVNRYGAARSAVSKVLARTAPTQAVAPAQETVAP